jgi:hypothetical protein
MISDLARLANDALALANTTQKYGTHFGYSASCSETAASAIWLEEDLRSLWLNCKKFFAMKKETDQIDPVLRTLESDQEINIDNQIEDQKLTELQRRLILYVLPTVEGIAAIFRCADSNAAAWKCGTSRIINHLCFVTTSSIRCMADFIQAKSGSKEQIWAHVKIAIMAACLITDLAAHRCNDNDAAEEEAARLAAEAKRLEEEAKKVEADRLAAIELEKMALMIIGTEAGSTPEDNEDNTDDEVDYTIPEGNREDNSVLYYAATQKEADPLSDIYDPTLFNDDLVAAEGDAQIEARKTAAAQRQAELAAAAPHKAKPVEDKPVEEEKKPAEEVKVEPAPAEDDDEDELDKKIASLKAETARLEEELAAEDDDKDELE